MRPLDVQVLFADLQPVLVRNSRTNSPAMIAAASGALARVAAILRIPVFFSVVPEDGRPPTHLPTLAGHVTSANTFVRQSASPFMDRNLVEAMAGTGRRTLVVAGFATEAVTLKAALDGLTAGYDVHVALDAGGGRPLRPYRSRRPEGTLASYMDIVTTMFGGMAAELEVLGTSSELSGGAADSDLARATKLVARMELDLGLGASLATLGRTPDDEVAQCLRLDQGLRRRVERTLADCLERARGFVRERHVDLEAVAACLEREGVWQAGTSVPSGVVSALTPGTATIGRHRQTTHTQGRAAPG